MPIFIHVVKIVDWDIKNQNEQTNSSVERYRLIEPLVYSFIHSPISIFRPLV